jgi:PKD repeat protein
VTSWYWDFGVPSISTDTSTVAAPTYTYPDSGTYVMKLVVNRGQQCADSATANVKVYPGFFPDFTYTGGCKDFPLQFIDNTTSNYGTVTGWRWNFGDLTTLADTSLLQNPGWQYPGIGTKTVRLIVGNTKGCVDTVFHDVIVFDKPPITLSFRDTLICSIDTLQLMAQGTGNFSWTPNYNIYNQNTATPSVYPKTTTYYTVQLDDRGCINHDSIRVRVVDFVTLSAPLDTTICLTDSVTLRPSGDGLQFTWTPPATLNNPNIKNPVARPTSTTMYYVTAHIGKCSALDSVRVRTVPYPGANAGPNFTICYDDTVQLIGSIVGTGFTWSSISTLINPTTLTPLAFPLHTTAYVLTAYDSLSGCPKPSFDTVLVTVRPEIIAFAGNDTNAVVGQPLQLNASGGMLYSWSPPTGLNQTNIRNPIAILNDNITYIVRAYTPEDCEDYDTINIRVFKTNPDIFVPNAFTPTRSANRLFRPIPVGATIDYFRVYNRWGQLVWSSNEAHKGWDGTLNGKLQDPGTYVWMVRGVDFTGKVITKKGTMILVR